MTASANLLDDPLPFTDPDFLRDPYPYYAALREREPVFRHPDGMWIVTSYDLVSQLLHDRSLSVAKIDFGAATPLHHSVLGADTPDHTRLRRGLGRWFTPRLVARWKEVAEAELARRLAEIAERGGAFDAIHDLAFPVTFTIISRILGVPEIEAQTVRRTTIEIGVGLGAAPPSDEDAERGAEAFRWLMAHAERLIADKEREPGEGMIDAFLAQEREGTMTREETIAQIVLLFSVGHLDIVFLVVNGIRILAEDSRIADIYRDRPDERDRVITEMLRYETPEHFVARLTTQDTVLGDVTVPAGELILVFIGAANRDPAAYPDPDVFDHLRDMSHGSHMAFGGGVHGCVGQILARAEARVFFDMLTETQDLALAGEPDWQNSDLNRALEHLPIRMTPRT